jgi:glycogen operon protein
MGNNNGYCQDNELSWLHWDDRYGSAEALYTFAKRLIALRQAHSILKRENWRDGLIVTWLNPSGGEQTDEQWDDEANTAIGLRLSRKQPFEEGWDDVLILFNPLDADVGFTLPDDKRWALELSTSDPDEQDRGVVDKKILKLEARSLSLLRPA